MTIVIGGLLSSILLSAPVARPLDLNAYAYCITYDLQLQDESIDKTLMESKENLQLMKIDELIGAINDQNRSLKSLLKEKTKVLDKIQTMLDFCAYTKTPLNEFQLDSFTHFADFYSREAGELQNALNKIDSDKELLAAKKELLHKEANYSAVIAELTLFSKNLNDAIYYLSGIIELGNSTLQIL